MKKNITPAFFYSKFLISLIVFFSVPSILSAQTPSWAFEGGTGSANAEFAKSVCVDASGNVYVIGSFSNTNDFDFGAGSSPLTSSGSNDGFFASYTSTGVFRWAVKVGGSTAFDNNLQSGAICTDGTNVYVTGNYNGAGVTLGSTVLPTSTGADTYVAKLNASTGATVWTVTYGGSGNNDQGQGICLDPSGNVYVVGTYNNTMTTACGTSANAGANPDLYIIKFNSGGTCQWMSTGGAAGSGDGGAGSGIAYVPAVNEVVVASSFSTNATYGTLTLTNNGNAGNNDLCILELNASSGTFLTAVGAGSTSNINANDDACAITYDPVTGDVFATGGFSGDVAFPGAGTLVNNGNTLDMWVARYSITNNNFTWAKASTGSSTDRGYGITNDGSGSVVVSAGYSSPTFTLGSFVLTNTNSSALEDVCIASYAGSNGAEQWQLKNTNTGTQPVGSNGRGISYQTGTGKYWVCGAFAQGCQFGSLGTMNSSGFADWYIAKLNAPPVLSATQSQVNLTCNGVCNGSATVVASGGIAPYTYSWSPSGGSGATASGLCATNYTCTITDANSTSITKTFSITQPPAITSSVVTQTNVSCNGGNNGTATITSAGGTGTRTFSWSPSPGAGQGTVSVTGLTAQVYTCTITDANSCSHQQTVNITQPTSSVSGTTVVTNISCFGGSNGAINLTPVGGTSGYTFNWLPSGPTTEDRTGLTAGTYSVLITDANGCTGTVTATVTQPALPVSGTTVVTNVACFGGSNGAIDLTPTGGSSGYTYNWLPSGPTTQDRTGLTAGTYSVLITDANGCTGTVTATVTQPASPVSGTTIVTNVACFGGSNGAIDLTPTGGSSGYTYNWLPSGPTTQDRTGLTAGTYSVLITDANGCTGTVTATVTQPASPVSGTTVVTNVACFSGSNGAIDLTPTGGSSGYTYNWLPSGPTTQDRTGLTAGTYSVQVTDANGCIGTVTATVTQPTAITSSVVSQTNTSCNGGSNGAATISASNGTPGYTYSWSPAPGAGQGTVSVTGLTGQLYTCTITDANGCTKTQTVNITAPTAITSSVVSQTNISCNGGNNGTATISASNGTPGYTYSWSPTPGAGQGTVSVTGLTAQLYTCTITDANGCTKTQTVNITAPTAITSSVVSQTNVSCNGGNNGAATISANNGTPGYTYSWSPTPGAGQGTVSVTGLTGQLYTCTITDANGCTKTQTVNITAPTAITSSVVSQTNVSCNGGNNGATTISASNGTPGYTYSWSPTPGAGQGTVSVTGLTAQLYTCTITDANGCTKTQTVNITAPTAITSSVVSQTNISCNGGNNGAATISASNGTPGYTYSWSPTPGAGQGTVSVTGLTAQLYTCTITDANGCTKTQTVNITAPTAITSSVVSQTNVSCNGGNNGAATISASNGTPGYTYSWSPAPGAGQGTVSVTGLTGQLYTCTITDANGCTKTQTVNITAPTAITSSVVSQTNVSCNGGNNGAATISASNGTPGYTYSWSPAPGAGQGTVSVTGLTGQLYTCTITDANGCTKTQTVNITAPTAITSSVVSQTNVSCNGGNTGAATISASGGTPGYTYSWSPAPGAGQGTVSVTGLTAQLYTCTITDANSCTHQQTVNITSPTAITSSVVSQTNISCNGGNNGTATISASGGTPGYTYSWSPAPGAGQGTVSVTGLTAQLYTCTITDANTCTHQQTVNITAPTAITSSVVSQTNVSCNAGNNGSATISASGGTPGYTYSWSPAPGAGQGTVSVTGLTAQLYTCTITDANLCTHQQTVNITQPTPLVMTFSVTNVLCNGACNGSVTAIVSGGTPPYSFVWTPNFQTTVTAFGLCAGTYTCNVTDANGCMLTLTVNVTQPPAITASVTSQTNITCNGGSNGAATITASGGTGTLTYNWSPGNPSGDGTNSVTGLTAGVWSCDITDINGCTITQTVNITEPPAITSSVSSQINVSCFGGNNGSATISASGGAGTLTYSWLPSGGNAATASGLTAQIYACTISDANSCTHVQSVTITEPPALAVTSSQVDLLCNGNSSGSASVTVSGGTPGYTYLWSPSGGSNPTATGLAAGPYSCLVTDLNGCTITQTFTLTEPSAISITASQTDVSCNGGTNGSAILIVSGGTPGYSYLWNPIGGTSATATGLNAGPYTCLVTDANGCTLTQSITITEPTALTATTMQTNVSCFGGNNGDAMVMVSGGTGTYTYVWSPTGGSTNAASGLIAGPYSCNITDVNNCLLTETFSITEPSQLVTASSATSILCNGGTSTVTVTASGGIAPYSGDGTFTENAGNHSYIVTDANGCTSTATLSITEPAVLSSSVTGTTNPSACGGTDGAIDITVSGGTTAYTFSWSNSSTNEDITGIGAGSYSCTITDANGCTDIINASISDPNAPTVTLALPMDTACGSFPGLINLSGGSPAGGTWSGVAVSGNTFDPFAAGVGNHFINYTYTDISGCTGSATDSIYVDVCIGIESVNAATGWSLFPNPTNGEFTITSSGNQSGTILIEIYSTDGKLIMSENKASEKTIHLNLTDKPVGTYFVRITGNNAVSTYRVIRN